MSEVKDVKITSAEKVKDPRRVEAGKKLGAMSKQAKEAKRSSENGSVREVESEFQISNLANVDPLTAIGVVGVIGVVAYYGCYGYYRKDSKGVVELVSDREGQSEPVDREDVVETPATPKPKRVYRQLDTLG